VYYVCHKTTIIRYFTNNESSEVCGNIMPGQRVKLNRSQAINIHKLLTIRNLPRGQILHDMSCDHLPVLPRDA